MTARTWYVSCSPRSPEKIAPELNLLANYANKIWTEKDVHGNNINQIEFAMSLKNLPTFEGSIYSQDPAFSARDRFAPMQTFGFAYVDRAGYLRITPAGEQLIKGERTQELFLKQMLKWQYPSWQHGGKPLTRHLYPPANSMNLFPYVAVLKACSELDGIDKYEIATFLLPLMDMNNIDLALSKVLSFRLEKNKLHGVERKAFLREFMIKEFGNVYHQELLNNNLESRESPTTTKIAFLKKKTANALDVADATVRYFRASGLFTLSSDYRRLVISPLYKQEAFRILSEMSFTPVTFYDDVDSFYNYFGDPSLPSLPWETKAELSNKVVRLGLSHRVANKMSIIEMKDFIDIEINREKQQKFKDYMIEAQKDNEVQDILNTFDRILKRDVVDPPLFFEWNIWRAMVSINDCENPHPNFTLDDDLKPFSHAPGNKADLEIEYNEKFVALVEVTLSSGARQYDTEGEPVTRHIGRYQKQESESRNPRTVYGLFVAPNINPATRNYFYVHLKAINNPDFGGYLNIVPLNMLQFIDVFSFIKSLSFFKSKMLLDLFENIIELKDVTENAAEWETQTVTAINEWKERWGKYKSA